MQTAFLVFCAHRIVIYHVSLKHSKSEQEIEDASVVQPDCPKTESHLDDTVASGENSSAKESLVDKDPVTTRTVANPVDVRVSPNVLICGSLFVLIKTNIMRLLF